MNKKKVLFGIILLLLLFILYLIYIKISFNNCVNNTIKYDKKINYSTNIILKINNGYSNSKIDYDRVKSYNITKISISRYLDNKLGSTVNRYIVNKGGKITSYVYNGNKYIKEKPTKDFDLNYKLLKKSKVISYTKNKYIIKMKASDAYNLTYASNVMNKKKLKSNVKVTIITNKDNFIKEISYNIDNMNKTKNKDDKINYKVKIVNRDINNQDTIKLPFKN